MRDYQTRSCLEGPGKLTATVCRATTAVAVTVALALVACAADRGTSSEARPRAGQGAPFAEDALIIVAGATNVRQTRDYDGSILYDVEQAFPGKDASDALQRRLSDAGWQPADDLFNPGMARERDWGMVTAKERTVFTWSAYWADRDGNMLLVSRTYDVIRPGGVPTATPPLHVQVTRFSLKTAETIRKAMKPRD